MKVAPREPRRVEDVHGRKPAGAIRAGRGCGEPLDEGTSQLFRDFGGVATSAASSSFLFGVFFRLQSQAPKTAMLTVCGAGSSNRGD